MTREKLEHLQSAIREQGFDGWLFYDHHHRDPIAYRILSLDEHSFVSRRWFYFIPAQGDPRKLVHRIESFKLDSLPGATRVYSSWQELEAELAAMLGGATKIAMQYSPRNAIMYVSMVDAGTVELVRSMHKEVVSSADIVSLFEAVLTDVQIATHYAAQAKLDAILQAAWTYIGEGVRAGRAVGEIDVVAFLQQGIAREGLFTDHGPNCSVGANSADSHYEPTAASSRTVRSGDFILIDVWAKLASANDTMQPDPLAVWYDITWTGVVGREPSEFEQHIFATVRDARDAAIHLIQDASEDKRLIPGWQADDAARNVIRAAGFADFFTHRTGHNIATELHGNGAHLDNLETHDERLLLSCTCFSVEPGLYFPEGYDSHPAFGIRSEVDMIVHPTRAVVTGPAQQQLVRI
jgi:Xaa-Pro dipeptidase